MSKSTNTKNSIKGTVIVSLILILFSFSIYSLTKKKNKYEKIKIKYNLPFVKSNGDVGNVTDSLSIIYKGNNIIYEIPYYYYSKKKETLGRTKTIFKYFVYQNGSELGTWFDSINAPNKKTEKIINIHKEKTILSPPDLFDETNDVLINTIRNKEGYTTIETYIPKFKKDLTYPDTMKVYYKNRLKNIDYSLSKKLDSLKKLKVFKIRFIFNTKLTKDYPYRTQNKELNISIQEDSSSNASSYDYLINNIITKYKL
ncbi:hypothetical protein DMB65_06695 [Flavobacterium cheongpyeongense]|uniref:Uncharacterized protein n=1 Tax=Flavobacterium cheongpyeongense TaxID=2212651 RepID=A0A2V4BUU7_9FLAO|nr:hypothetical protein [Flavobacterium cheongpyeongense]PXY41633.1 hypothetical protein DMB65_06695 [Flavobacterium cheongpyeongense]